MVGAKYSPGPAPVLALGASSARAMIFASFSRRARWASSVWRDSASMTGPMSVEGSAGSPTTWAARAPFSPSIRTSAESFGT